VSRRHRWAAVASSLALLTAYGATTLLHAQAATSSQVMSDPAGDANTQVDANGGTKPVPNEPRADVISASATYQPGAIVLSIRTAQPGNPATDPEWNNTDTAITWFVDTTGDKQYDYRIVWGADSGALYSDVYSKANGDTTPICTGAGQGATPSLGSDGSYVVSINARCFANPAAFYWGGRTEWGNTGSLIMDRFPDGDGNYFGPVSAPGSTPPPTTPTSPPAGGGGGGPAPVPVPPTTTTTFRPIVAAPVDSNQGFWLLGRDGGVFSFGTAQFYGSIGNIPLNRQIVAMAAKPDSTGYWFVDSGGGIYVYKAPFWGSMTNVRLSKPIVGMAATPSGQGYWLVASDGGIFAFGDAPFYGSTGSLTLNQPIVGMAPSTTGKGYWFVASDGGIFAFGDAPFLGSAVSDNPVPVVGMAPTKGVYGYRVVRADGSVVPFGGAAAGSGLTGSLDAPVVGIVTAF
jgi:hypothetical protein